PVEARGIAPSSEADRFTLIKRLHYDLLGLPPEPEEADLFASDPSPDAWERLVDRLLASPHFGERWGRHWLDLARFADSDGYEKDRARPDAYVFRDWTIDAINMDMPFDRFTLEQVAGDLLPGAGARQRIATAFHRQTLTNEEGGVDQEEFRVAAAFDRTETLGTVWLGLTVGCARCHEHKYDPIEQAEYYRLFAFFNGSEEVTPKVPVAADDLDALERELRPLEEALEARHAALAPRALAWEAEEHRRIIAQPDSPLEELPLDAAPIEPAGGSEADRDAAVLVAPAPARPITGFRLHVLPDDGIAAEGAGGAAGGPAAGGRFVLTSFQASILRDGEAGRPIELHRAQADATEKGFSVAEVLAPDAPGRKGWAPGGEAGAPHWIQLRTREPLQLAPGTRLRFRIARGAAAGRSIGRFKVAALAGGVRGLHIAEKEIADALEMYPEKRVAKTARDLFEHFVERVARDEEALELEQRIAEARRRHGARLMDVRVLGRPLVPRRTRVFDRGDFLAPREEVEPGVPAVLPPLEPRSAPADRLDLARWLVSPGNPLAPRVASNHVWRHLFGAGLVRTANDFGVRGERPTHPELLDWLSRELRERLAWSRKALIRRIVLSAAYRQASRWRPELAGVDPSNALLARQGRFRVEGEVVRDVCLAAGGLLSRRIGGPSVFPPMPEDLAALSYANSFTWKASEGEDRRRRGLYTFFKRTIPHPSLTTFDCPDANVACAQRTVSNTPLQALLLLNNAVHVEAAQALARRVLEERPSGGDGDRLAYALRLCVTRPPRPEEVAALERVLAAARAWYAGPDGAREGEAGELAGALGPRGVPAAEAAAWVAAARVALNLDELIVRE
ncbi:MAG: DUF1553 domain-containing protein, partial [Planctomycetes bacterium]|nr:DUF1553 domain-containing protein [Planctomycetota bacterium]